MDQQFTPPPVIHPVKQDVPLGTPITIVPKHGPLPKTCEVLYTTDGSDPRQPDSKRSPHAQAMTSNTRLEVNNAITVKARLYDDGRWGALATQQFSPKR